jgi:hypothetical protein
VVRETRLRKTAGDRADRAFAGEPMVSRPMSSARSIMDSRWFTPHLAAVMMVVGAPIRHATGRILKVS